MAQVPGFRAEIITAPSSRTPRGDAQRRGVKGRKNNGGRGRSLAIDWGLQGKEGSFSRCEFPEEDPLAREWVKGLTLPPRRLARDRHRSVLPAALRGEEAEGKRQFGNAAAREDVRVTWRRYNRH